MTNQITRDDIPSGRLIVYCSTCDEAVCEADTAKHRHQNVDWFVSPSWKHPSKRQRLIEGDEMIRCARITNVEG